MEKFRFRFTSLRQKVLFGFSIVILLTFLLSAFIIISVHQVNRDLEKMMEQELGLLTVNGAIAYEMAETVNSIRGYILYDDERYREAFEASMELNRELEQQLLLLSNSDEIEALIREKSVWRSLTEQFFAEMDRGNENEATALAGRISVLSDELTVAFQEVTEGQKANIQELGQAIEQNTRSIAVTGVVTAIIVLILGVGIAIITANSISKPIRTVMDRVNNIAGGQLDHKPLVLNKQDETGQLVKGINTMQENMRELLSQIKQLSGTVSAHSEELTQSASEVTSVSEQVARTMEEIAAGAENQSNRANELASTTEEFTKKMVEANEKGENVKIGANEVLGLTEEGKELMNASEAQMNEIHRLVRDTVDKVERLDAYSEQVSKLVEVIQDIADQTNLLSLNASIEASHAGEHGRGFAIVAEEVRKLAEGVAGSVTDISKIVENMQLEVKVVTASLNDGYQEVEQGTEQIRMTNEKFENIRNAISQVVEDIHVITDNMSSLSEHGQKVNGTIQEIASISEQSAAGVQETSASTEQTTGSMEEVTASANELAKLADELNELVRGFKL